MPAVSEPVLIVVVIAFLLLGNGFFSGSEIAVISARRSRIDALVAEGSRAARRVRDLQDNMDRFLATAQIGVTVMGTLAGVLGGYLASRHLDPLLKDRGSPPSFPRRSRRLRGRAWASSTWSWCSGSWSRRPWP